MTFGSRNDFLVIDALKVELAEELTPCHLYMLQRPDLFPVIPLWALWLRLPVQIGFSV